MKAIHRSIHFAALAAVLAVTITFAGCGRQETADQDTPPASAPANPQLAAVLLADEPAGAVTVLAARQSVEPGAAVTVQGRIVGAKSPFTEGYAVFVLGDDTLETCELIPGDECPTPWDACCEAPEKIKASRLSVQVLGENGKPVPASMKGVGGLGELDAVVVSGTVAEGSTADNLIVNATGIFRQTP